VIYGIVVVVKVLLYLLYGLNVTLNPNVLNSPHTVLVSAQFGLPEGDEPNTFAIAPPAVLDNPITSLTLLYLMFCLLTLFF